VKSQFWPFTDVLRENWPAVTRKMEIFLNRRKPRQRSIRLDCARRKTVFVFFACSRKLSELSSVKAVWQNHYGATEKQIRPPIFHQRAETCLMFQALV